MENRYQRISMCPSMSPSAPVQRYGYKAEAIGDLYQPLRGGVLNLPEYDALEYQNAKLNR